MAEWAGGHLHTVSVTVLRVARCERSPGTEILNVLQLQSAAAEVQLDILSEGRVATGEDESVATNPLWVLRVETHHPLVEGVGERGKTHRSTGVAGTALLDGVGSEQASSVDSFAIEVCPIAGVVRFYIFHEFRAQ